MPRVSTADGLTADTEEQRSPESDGASAYMSETAAVRVMNAELYGPRFALEAVKRGKHNAVAKAKTLGSHFSTRKPQSSSEHHSVRSKGNPRRLSRRMRKFWRKVLASRTWVNPHLSPCPLTARSHLARGR